MWLVKEPLFDKGGKLPGNHRQDGQILARQVVYSRVANLPILIKSKNTHRQVYHIQAQIQGFVNFIMHTMYILMNVDVSGI